jgi:putative ABC transport system substrate-binding protein
MLEDTTMTRRTIGLLATLALGLLVTVLGAEAPPAGKVYRIGWLYFGVASGDILGGFRQGLRELGYVEGQNLTIEQRNAGGQAERLPDLAAALVQLPVDVLVAAEEYAAAAA